MKSRLSIATIIISMGITLTTATLVRGLYWKGEKEMVINEPSFFLETSSVPIQIIIPKISVDAKVEKVGITYAGNMSTPKKISNTGWYKYGTLPGEKGSAVIDGHVDNGFALPGVFKNLKKLVPGDNVFVKTENGSSLHFVVIEVERYYYTDVPRETLFTRNDKAYLNLITCDGDWIPEIETSNYRIVVYTVLDSKS
jgi:LPXTG-site transpeptidase (sortase) family protein